MTESIFETALRLLEERNKESLEKSLDNVHHDGLFSLVIGGTENGLLTRVFIATKKIKPYTVQLHSHTYNLKLGVIKGHFLHHTAVECGEGAKGMNVASMKLYKYQSPLNGGKGLELIGNRKYSLYDHYIPVGAEIFLNSDDIHTVSVSKGTMWIVQELGFNKNHSSVIGTEFIADGLYTQPLQYQVNDMWQKVYQEIKKL